MMKIKRWFHLLTIAATLGLFSSWLVAAQVQAQIDAFTFFMPFEAEAMAQRFAEDRVSDGTRYDNEPVEYTFSIAVLSDDTIIYYDEWEDGLEPDLTSPQQASTKVWGDSNLANNDGPLAAPQGIPADDRLVSGTVILLNNDVPTNPRDPANVFFDGGDKLVSVGGNVALTISAWPVAGPGPLGQVRILYADAWELYPTGRWGNEYFVPIGEDPYLIRNLDPNPPPGNLNPPCTTALTNSFRTVSINVQAIQDGTSVEIDLDSDDNFDPPFILNQGEQRLLSGTILAGAGVRSSEPVQVLVIASDPCRQWELRGYTLIPRSQWTKEYLAPRSSDGDFWLYNPNGSTLQVTAETITGTTTIDIPAGTTARFPPLPAPLLTATGVHFTASEDFYGVAALDASFIQDWGYALLPVNSLTTQTLIGWGVSNDNTPPGPGIPPGGVGDGTESQVFVTALSDTTIQVRYKDGTTFSLAVNRLQETPIVDPPNTFDMTGAFIFTDGTPFVSVWGQRDGAPDTTPSIDVGTINVPLTALAIQKTVSLIEDVDCTGSITLGDTVHFRLTYFNNTVNPIPQVRLLDNLLPELIYVANSTSHNGQPVADDTSGSPFPIDGTGFPVGDVVARSRGEVTFEVVINTAGVEVPNQAEAGSSDSNIGSNTTTIEVPIGGAPVLEVNKTLIDPITPTVVSGQLITFSLTITNVSGSNVNVLPVQDTFDPAQLTFVNASPPPDSITAGVITWNNLGALAIGSTTSATVNFTVNQLPPNVTTINNAAVVIGAERDDNIRPLNCGDNLSLAIAGPPTPTPTPPPPPDPTSSPGGGGNTTPRPPTLTPAPVAAIVPAPPTPVLPVTLLPETGIREFGWGNLAIMAGVLLVVLGGISAAIRFSNKD